MKGVRKSLKGARAMKFGSFLKTLREEKQYSQHYIAYKLGITQNAYSKLELDMVQLSLRRALELALIFDIDISLIIYAGIESIDRDPA